MVAHEGHEAPSCRDLVNGRPCFPYSADSWSVKALSPAAVFAGSTEPERNLFSRPGLGRLIVGGILAKDFPLVQGSVLFVATGYVLINVLVDIAYAFTDPRIRFG
jgi:ABC-type dipeptide/oligopeptide/nickel transport system permease component